ncbi:hypothetical protein KXQ82_17480 [Mucilaginibacter sp. HMF5004]|uniref:hypothetical protein n=1 Tax=Mucilaginibacter rivuli TaxID=2857527 RepID=UPI001C602653|nr:hypothetical protein [Mucilaginibacter rivuli]MBW4891523.1 hypothetical protein [Mucilaginibacter rivuli]
MTLNIHDPLDDKNKPGGKGMEKRAQNDLITDLLHQIIRVKELIKFHEAMPDAEGMLAASILNELVAEAHRSLVDYDPVLMKKYYDLLLNCD